MEGFFVLLVPTLFIGLFSNDRLINTNKIHGVHEIVIGYIYTCSIVFCIIIYMLFKKDIMMILILFVQFDIARMIVFFKREPKRESNLKMLNKTHAVIFTTLTCVSVLLALVSSYFGGRL